MDFISSWLKGVVLIILFASFMDLLLPSSSMQKYVKLVIGLIIVVAMLTPLLVVLHGREAFSGNDFLNWQGNELLVTSVMKDVERKIASDYEDMVVDTARKMVEDGLTQAILLHGAFHLVDFEMSVDQPTDGHSYKITQLRVYVKRISEQVGSADRETMMREGIPGEGLIGESVTRESVEPIAIETVEIAPILLNIDQGVHLKGNEREEDSVYDERDGKELREILAKHMEISEENIRIYIVEEG